MNKFYENIRKTLPEIIPFLDDMANTMQEPLFHAEGDVLTHTLMVLDEVEKLDIDKERKDILRWTAILHDIGKPNTTETIDGVIHSYGHSRVGYHITLELLENVEMSFEDKLQIANLVKNHVKPVFSISKENPEIDIIKQSLDCDIELLYLFAKCDNNGRISENKLETISNIEYFKMYAEALNCFKQPYPFANNIAKFKYLVEKSHYHTDIPYDDTKSKVHLMVGLPGSGKDYYIKNNLKDLPVVSLDEIRKELKIKPTGNQGKVIQLAKERAKEFLRKGTEFVWNSTNTTRDLRGKTINLFTTYNAYITIHYINKDLNTILEQNKNRTEVVPENVIRKLYRKIDIPSASECHELKIV